MIKVPRSFVADFEFVTADWPADERELARQVARDAFARGDRSPIETFSITAAEVREAKIWG